MGEVITLSKKRQTKPLIIDGKKYIYIDEFAERMGIETTTVYNWRSEGRLSKVAKHYLGRLVFEDKAIEPFKRSLIENAVVYR